MIKPLKLNLYNMLAMMRAGASDEEIMLHYRMLLFDVRVVAQHIGRARNREKLKIERALRRSERKMIDPAHDSTMRAWKKIDLDGGKP